ncbi:MAG: hypothetical protein A2W93_11810 [Bacteroidetes bacterium GWF2_43_63]|nr:MAG: hypothetical protein A2W94_04225 [Bacteroidetes bacterium GWE2_42_42]OFY52411.1 MAG: hypothetical protein A2W93_11810 [Bacteroidetes bacterium GWF2_43_63]HBG71648.1 hypothetical protein [Bacteroidales bacterium]HCB61162.1 hypothetical protein [Bacteroidales bacterium]HCY23389.1 hypothetical protein [Bacteroidales bacterium]
MPNNNSVRQLADEKSAQKQDPPAGRSNTPAFVKKYCIDFPKLDLYEVVFVLYYTRGCLKNTKSLRYSIVPAGFEL